MEGISVELLSDLSPREAKIICMIYGLGTSRKYSMSEIGQQFGVSKARIDQVKSAAMKKIMATIEKQNIVDTDDDEEDDDPYDLGGTYLM